MRILLDEAVPRRLGGLLAGHEVTTVPRVAANGWAQGEAAPRAV